VPLATGPAYRRLIGRCRATVGFGDGLFFGRVLFAGAIFGVFDRFLVPLVANAAFARAVLTAAVARDDGFIRLGFFAGRLAADCFDGLLVPLAAAFFAGVLPGFAVLAARAFDPVTLGFFFAAIVASLTVAGSERRRGHQAPRPGARG
jgi:hypothetical protein